VGGPKHKAKTSYAADSRPPNARSTGIASSVPRQHPHETENKIKQQAEEPRDPSDYLGEA
jgi:hypothetical protein